MYSGSCHCGRISFEVDGEFSEVMECNCSHCSRKGYLPWFVPRSQLRLKSPEDSMSSYKFNRHVIDHHFCPSCGCAPFGFWVSSSGAATAAVNVRCLEGVEFTTLKRNPFDGRRL